MRNYIIMLFFMEKHYTSSRKNATEKIAIRHGKILLIPTHYNVYNIIYVYMYIMYAENCTEKNNTYLLTFKRYLISRKIIVTSLVGIKILLG